MKKTLIALAAIAAVSSAMADVTIAGYFDRGFVAKNSTNGAASSNTIGSNAGTTGLFFKGNEALTSDLSGIFSIETDFLDLGGASQASTVNYTDQAAGFANGEVFIGLQSAGMGSLKLGSPNFFMLGAVTSVGAPGFGTGIGSTFSATGFQIFNGISTGAGSVTNTAGIATISTTPAAGTANYGARDIRITNSVQLQSTDFGGLKFGLTFAPQNNNATASSGLNNTVGVSEYNLRYTNAASGIDATYDLIKYTVGSNGVETVIAGVNTVAGTNATPTLTGNSTSTHSFVGATYTYNPSIKLHGGYGTSQSGDNVYQTRSAQLGATYTMGQWDLMAQSAQVTDAGNSTYTANRSITGIGANYNFSKMTRAYARYETVNYATNQAAFSGSVVTRTAVGVSTSF